MVKTEELTNPKSCMSRAGEHEMTFVLLARDAAAPEVIRFWVRERIRLGKNDAHDNQILEALHCANLMEQQRTDGIGLPDRAALPGTVEEERKAFEAWQRSLKFYLRPSIDDSWDGWVAGRAALREGR